MMSDFQSNPSEAALLSILDATKSRGLSGMGPLMVNALATSLVDHGHFDDVITVTSETMYQLWPSLMDGYKGHDLSAPDPLVPDLVRLASNLARAYMRSNRMEGAGRVYWHLFQAMRHSDTVDDESDVFEYANLALTAFEQFGQVDQMVALREDLLDHCLVKHGEDHPIALESRYALGSLFLQQQVFEKAKQHYFRIVNDLKQPTFAALPALRKLIDICCREQCWDQALQVYASLWTIFLTKGLEYGFDSSRAKALYAGYTDLLQKQDPVETGVLHEVTESYRSACLTMFGEHDPATMEAALFLADSWNGRRPGCVEAVRLYEWLVDEQEGIILDQRDDTRATVEAAQNFLIEFYQACVDRDNMQIQGASSTKAVILPDEYLKMVRVQGENTSRTVILPEKDTTRATRLRGNTLTRAIHLQGKRYDHVKMRQGAYQPATLSNLVIWISMLQMEDSQDSQAVAVRELQLAVDAVISSDLQPSALYHAAVVLATSFSAGFVEEGIETVQRLTEQVIFQQDDVGDNVQHAKRSDLVFLTAFEEYLTGSTMGFAEIHAKVLMESALWESYKRLNQAGADPGMTLACGARLHRFLREHKSQQRATLVEQGLYERFLEFYGAAFTHSIQTARDLFLVLLNELSSDRLKIDIPTLSCIALIKRVGSLLEEGHYQSALHLSTSGPEFVRFVGSFANSSNLERGFRFALMLMPTNADVSLITDYALAKHARAPDRVPAASAPASNHDTAAQMLKLSGEVLTETLQQCPAQSFNFITMDIQLISHVASVLGLQQNYEELEVRSQYGDDFLEVEKY